MTTEIKPSAFTMKDYLTITFSAIALTISVINFYYSNLRIEDNLQARFYTAYLEPPLSDSIETGVIQVALFNMGNRQAIFVNSVFEFAPSLNDTVNYVLANHFENNKDFPIILEAHEVKMINLKLSFKKKGEIELNGLTTHTKVFFNKASLKLRLIALDSKAGLHGVDMEDVKVDIFTTDKGDWRFKPHFDSLEERTPLLLENKFDKTTIIFKE